ncbi:unnamed protein product [Camellia sinensis]
MIKPARRQKNRGSTATHINSTDPDESKVAEKDFRKSCRLRWAGTTHPKVAKSGEKTTARVDMPGTKAAMPRIDVLEGFVGRMWEETSCDA